MKKGVFLALGLSILMLNASYCLAMEKEKKRRISDIQEITEPANVSITRQQLIKAILNNDLSWIESNVSKLSEQTRRAVLNSTDSSDNVLYQAFEHYDSALHRNQNDKAEIALKIFEKLLEYGANINQRFVWSKGDLRTVLSHELLSFDGEHVSDNKNIEEIKLLLDSGADITTKMKFKKTYALQTPLEFINSMIALQQEKLNKLVSHSPVKQKKQQALENTLKVKALLEEAPTKREAARKKALEQELKAKEGERLLNRVQANPPEAEILFLQSLQRESGVKMKD